MNSDKLIIEKIEKVLDDNKGEEITTIKMSPGKSLFDYSVIVTSQSKRHSESLVDKVIYECKKLDIKNIKVEGDKDSDWILLDLGGIMVDIFTKEGRERYSLEDLWKDHEMQKLEHGGVRFMDMDIEKKNAIILKNRLQSLYEELKMVESSLKKVRHKEIIDKATSTESTLISGIEYERKNQEIRAIKNALNRMHEGSYGICIECEKRIDESRLEIMPTAKFCMECRSRHANKA